MPDGETYEDLLRRGSAPYAAHPPTARVPSVRSSGGQRRAGVRRSDLKGRRAGRPALPDTAVFDGVSQATAPEVQGVPIRNGRPPIEVRARYRSRGSRPRRGPAIAGAPAGRRPEAPIRQLARPPLRNRRCPTGHHGVARRAIGSTINTAAHSRRRRSTPSSDARPSSASSLAVYATAPRPGPP